MNASGLCECGCGELAALARSTDPRKGMVKNTPLRFARGHHFRGALHPNWKGGRTVNRQGYVKVARIGNTRYVPEHVAVAESILGHPLPVGAVVHHVNGNKADNRPANLVICEDQAYHVLLHARERAVKACGNPNWQLCCRCKRHDAPANLRGYTVNGKPAKQVYHAACQNEYTKRHPSHQVKEKRGIA